jgi:hypothetical protein
MLKALLAIDIIRHLLAETAALTQDACLDQSLALFLRREFLRCL